MNVVITGASRGIGLELTRLALKKENKVMAIARDPASSPGLSELNRIYSGRLQMISADLEDFSAPAKIAGALKDWPQVDLLINNAGVMRKGIAPDDFMLSFKVNSVAPFLLTQELLPWLKKSPAAKAIHITSLMGSIEDNKGGGYYAYRSSKAALNMINMSLARDLEWLSTIVIHPGWVKTAMGGTGAPLEAEDSAAGIWAVGEGLNGGMSGKFYDHSGKELPW